MPGTLAFPLSLVGRRGIEPRSSRYERPVLAIELTAHENLERMPGDDPGDRDWQPRAQPVAYHPHIGGEPGN